MFFRKYIIKIKQAHVKRAAQSKAKRSMVAVPSIYFKMKEHHTQMLESQRKEQTKEYLYHRGAYEALKGCFKNETGRKSTSK